MFSALLGSAVHLPGRLLQKGTHLPRPLRNVVQRNRIFHFRRAIPDDLRLLFGQSELTCSLRTSELRAAEFRSRQLYIASETLFIENRRHIMLSDDQLAPIVQDFYAYVLDQENQWRLRLGAITEEARLRRAGHFKKVATRGRTDLARNVLENVYFIALVMMRKHNLVETLDNDEKNQLRQALLRGGIDLAEAVRARYEGDFNYEPRDRLLKRKVEALFATSPAPVPPGTPVREPSPASDAPSFSTVSADFITKQKQLRRWENQTAAQNEKSYALFGAICGDYPLAKYTKKDAAIFKDVIERLPADYGKGAQYRGKTPQQILQIDAANGAHAERLSIRTVKRHISALSTLWDEVIAHGEATENIFSGFKFPQQQRAQDQRPMWLRNDLARLFETPIWTGCKSAHRRSTAGSETIRDEKFWLPLIAVFSGARQEEICQLHVADVREEEGV